MADHLPTDDRIEVPIPSAVAAEFVKSEAWKTASLRSVRRLQLGTSDLGWWRIDGIEAGSDGGQPRAFLRRVLINEPPAHEHSWQGGKCITQDCPTYCYCVAGGMGGHQRSVPRCPELASGNTAPNPPAVDRG